MTSSPSDATSSMEKSSDNPNEGETPPNRDPSAPLPVPNSGSGVIFRRRPTTGRLSTDSGTSDAEGSPNRRRHSSTDDGDSPRRISVGAESGYGSPFAPSTSAGQTYFNFAFSPPLMSGVQQPDMARFSVPQQPPEQGQQRRRASSEASTFRSIGTQTLTVDFGALCRDEEDDDDDNISLEGSYADDAFYEDEEQEALGMAATGGPLPDVVPEAHNLNLPNGRGALPRNRAHSVSFPIDELDPEGLGRCLRTIATEFDATSICPQEVEVVNIQDEMVNEGPEETLPIPTGNPGFFAFLRSSIVSSRRQRSLSASEVLSSIWAASQAEPQERRASEAPSMANAASTPTQTPRYNMRHPDKFL